VIYLAGGDLIGRHNAPAAQLFAVVAGAGWVSGREESSRDLGPGYAALWDEGEPHEAGTEEGMTAPSAVRISPIQNGHYWVA